MAKQLIASNYSPASDVVGDKSDVIRNTYVITEPTLVGSLIDVTSYNKTYKTLKPNSSGIIFTIDNGRIGFNTDSLYWEPTFGIGSNRKNDTKVFLNNIGRQTVCCPYDTYTYHSTWKNSSQHFYQIGHQVNTNITSHRYQIPTLPLNTDHNKPQGFPRGQPGPIADQMLQLRMWMRIRAAVLKQGRDYGVDNYYKAGAFGYSTGENILGGIRGEANIGDFYYSCWGINDGVYDQYRLLKPKKASRVYLGGDGYSSNEFVDQNYYVYLVEVVDKQVKNTYGVTSHNTWPTQTVYTYDEYIIYIRPEDIPGLTATNPTVEVKPNPIVPLPPKPYVPSPSIPEDNSPIHSFIHKDVKFYQDFISGSATASGELFIGNDITVEQVERMLNLATWYLFNPRRTVGLNREFAEADFHFDTPKTPLPENGDFSTVPNRDRDLRYRENHFAFLGNIPVFDKAEISSNPLLRKKMDAYVNWRTKNPSDNLEQLGTPGVNVTWINSRLMNVNRLVDRPKPISILGTIQHLDIERFDKVPSNNGEDQNFTSNEYTYQDKPLSVTELIRTIKYVAQRYSRIAKVEYGRSNLNKYQDYFFTTQSNDTIKNLIEQGIDALLVKKGDGERDLVPGEEVSMQKVWEFIVDVANVIYTVARDNAPIVNIAVVSGGSSDSDSSPRQYVTSRYIPKENNYGTYGIWDQKTNSWHQQTGFDDWSAAKRYIQNTLGDPQIPL